MQLASIFMQFAASERLGAKKYIFTVFLKGNVNSALEWGLPYSKFSFREVYRRIYLQKSRFMAPLTRRRKTKFPTIYPTIYLPKWKFWIQLSPKCVSIGIEFTWKGFEKAYWITKPSLVNLTSKETNLFFLFISLQVGSLFKLAIMTKLSIFVLI